MNRTETGSYLLFTLGESHYAVEASAVREILPLPEVAPLNETPDYVVGVIDLRDQIVPIFDLNRRFGLPAQRYCLDDCLILLDHAGSSVGIIVNAVQSVREFTANEQVPIPAFGDEIKCDVRLLAGLFKWEEQVVMLLHLDNLLRLTLAAEAALGSGEIGAEESRATGVTRAFCPDATPEERAVFRERASRLAQVPASQESVGAHALVVLRLQGEYFGVALESVREFTEAREITPVPCCPAHILGLMNLRGDLITIVDIAETLGLPPLSDRTGGTVVVLHRADLSAGVLVDAVLDTFALPATARIANPANSPTSDRDFRLGRAPYGTQMLSLIDLSQLLMQQNLSVNETL